MEWILLELPLWVTNLAEQFHYLGPAIVLFLCGVGLPLPEELTLILAGMMVDQQKVQFLPIVLVCALAILVGDSMPYLLGRKLGSRALKHPWVSRVLHPERFALVEEKFRRHGSLMIFFSRFLPGIRIPAYFTAGTLGMGYIRFVLLDSLGVLISVPVSIWIAVQLSGQVEKMKHQMENFHLILAFALIAVLTIGMFRMVIRRRERQVRALGADAPSPSSVPGSETPAPAREAAEPAAGQLDEE